MLRNLEKIITMKNSFFLLALIICSPIVGILKIKNIINEKLICKLK